MEDEESKQANYFVGMMDILGFKNLISQNKENLEKVKRTLVRNFRGIPDFTEFQNSPFFMQYHTPGQAMPDVVDPEIVEISRSVTDFSDTIIFYIETGAMPLENLRRFQAMCFMMNRFLVLSNLYPGENYHQLALRGAIAYGKAYMDDDKILIGQPIVDAHLLSEAQEWMGGAIHPSVFNCIRLSDLESLGMIGFDAPLCNYPVPLKYNYKSEVTINIALNWISHHPAGTGWFPSIPIRRPLYSDIISGNFDKYDWGSEEKQWCKKENTLTFARNIFHHYDRPGQKYYWPEQWRS
jgi:hypothetical protein